MSKDFATDVALALIRVKLKHPKSIASTHQSYALLLEELDEYWEEVKADGCNDRLYMELVDIAVMCQRIAEDLQLGPHKDAT